MRFASADGSFAIEIEHIRGLMFSMGISVRGTAIGGDEGWGPTSLQALAGIKEAIDDDLRPDASAGDLAFRLRSDDNFDRYLMSMGANFDRWGFRGFARGDRVVLLIDEWHATDPPEADVYVLDRTEYFEVVSLAKGFYDAHATRP